MKLSSMIHLTKIRLYTYCWRCGTHRNEWFGWLGFVQRRGKCFFCRIDDLDIQYGPGYLAKMYRLQNKDKQFLPAPHFLPPLDRIKYKIKGLLQ